MSKETVLYLVATPIGNLGDITYRAVEVLKSVDKILAEDTRTSGVLLKHYGITTPMESFHAFNEHHKVNQVIERLKKGERLALITDAGTPGISDPGFLLVREALKNDLSLECLPGATAFVPALVQSGFPCDRFIFEGFLPAKKGRQTKLKQLAEEDRTVILYESPHRLLKTLEQLSELMEQRLVSVSRELTKKFEETVNGTFEEVISHFKDGTVKGEFVIVIGAK
ncbi:MAG: 16S rRNA (cytidine(1402)-2'-O)-methyltransferase [Cyclobacteriaceae bacterium]